MSNNICEKEYFSHLVVAWLLQLVAILANYSGGPDREEKSSLGRKNIFLRQVEFLFLPIENESESTTVVCLPDKPKLLAESGNYDDKNYDDYG